MGTPIAKSEPPVAELTLDNLFEFPEGRKVLTCIQCGMCAGTCPHGEVMDYPPRRIIGMLRAGLIEKVFTSEIKCLLQYSEWSVLTAKPAGKEIYYQRIYV